MSIINLHNRFGIKYCVHKCDIFKRMDLSEIQNEDGYEI